MTHHTEYRVQADTVLFRWHDSVKEVLLVLRRYEPFKGLWALPGGHVEPTETCFEAARRELMEETGIYARDLHEIGVFDGIGRDPRGRAFSVAFSGWLGPLDSHTAVGGDDAVDAQWWPVSALPHPLGFDHIEMILSALGGRGQP